MEMQAVLRRLAGVVAHEGEQRSKFVLAVLADVFLMDVSAANGAGTGSYLRGITGGADGFQRSRDEGVPIIGFDHG